MWKGGGRGGGDVHGRGLLEGGAKSKPIARVISDK